MKYKYIPDSYNYELINEKYNEEEFIDLQNQYREYLEKLLKSIIDFKDTDAKIKQIINVPKINDSEYNFYHKFSTLGSDYIYLRNNFHIEKLNDEELSRLKNNDMDYDYLKSTLSKVIFEEGDKAFYGNSILKYLANSKSIVFEFSYDQQQLVDVKELKTIESIIQQISEYLTTNIEKKLNIPVSIIVYDGIHDIYKQEDENQMIIQ